MTSMNSGFCFNCLNKDHRIANCHSKTHCRHSNCNKRRNTLLHRDFQIDRIARKFQEGNTEQPNDVKRSLEWAVAGQNQNSKPLTKTSADSSDIECLTPNHFIIPRRSNLTTTMLNGNKHTDRLIQLNRQCESNAIQFWTRLMKK